MRFRPFPPNTWNSKDKTIMLHIIHKRDVQGRTNEHTFMYLDCKIKVPQNFTVLKALIFSH